MHIRAHEPLTRARTPRAALGARLRWAALLLWALALVVAARPSLAEDKRTENAAKDALKKANAEYDTGRYDPAIARLQKALTACGASKCTTTTKATVLRDLGVMQWKKGDKESASVSFVQSLALEPSLDMPFEGNDLRDEWEASRDEASLVKSQQPSGDFKHTPPAAQAVRTPLPLYFEISGGNVATAAIRYKGPGMREYKKLALSKVGDGWGAMIPCGDVTRGVVRYYVQGFGADGSPVAGNGSAREPYFVPIRVKISGAAPSLPGSSPPSQCAEGSSGAAATPEPSSSSKRLALGEACDEAAQCESGHCKAGECVAAPRKQKDDGGYARLWIGVNTSVDFVSLPAANDVCALTSSAVPVNTAGYYCTRPDGPDFPSRSGPQENATLGKGNAGNAAGGFTGRDVRVMASLDYAFSPSLLVGARVGYVFGAYNGSAASKDGHGLSTPFHLELRATYLFGDAPLRRSGFAPYVFASAGASELDAVTTVMVRQNGIAGDRPMQAWVVAGPLFFAAGGGGRYAISPRAAVMTGLRFMGALGGAGGMLLSYAPELSFAYGF